jgi:hypothetical protein
MLALSNSLRLSFTTTPDAQFRLNKLPCLKAITWSAPAGGALVRGGLAPLHFASHSTAEVRKTSHHSDFASLSSIAAI